MNKTLKKILAVPVTIIVWFFLFYVYAEIVEKETGYPNLLKIFIFWFGFCVVVFGGLFLVKFFFG